MDIVTTFVISIVASIVTAWVTVFLAFRRYKSEKWWDRKCQCYCETVNSLNEIMVVCDALIDEKVHGVILQKNEKLELTERHRKGKAFCFTQINIGQLLMSDEAHDVLVGFERALSTVEREEPRETLWEVVREVTEGHVNAFIPLAREDLDTHSFWSRSSTWAKQKQKQKKIQS